MTFQMADALLSAASLLIVLASSITLGYCAYEAAPLSGTWRDLAAIAVFVAGLYAVSLLELWLIRKIVPLIEGRHSLKNSRLGTAWKLQGFLYVFNFGLIINTGIVPINLRFLFFRLLGAKIGRGVMIGGKIIEPPMVEIGDFTILGENSLIGGHAVEGGSVVLGKVRIGRGVTLGGNSMVMPDVVIGDGSVVGAMSLVTKGTRIGPGELWLGIPARKVKDLV